MLTANGLGLYDDDIPEQTTYAYVGYMYFEAGTRYTFRASYDDYSWIRIDGATVIAPAARDCTAGEGAVSFPNCGWRAVDIRVSNGLGAGGNTRYLSTTYCGVWYKKDNGEWLPIADPGDGGLFRTGEDCLAGLSKDLPDIPTIISSQMRANDPTVMDVEYIVFSAHETVNVRALAFEDGERSSLKVVRPETFVDGTAANIGDGIAANVKHKLSWKVSSDWKTDLAKVKFEILTSDMAQLPLQTMTIPATAKYPAMTIAYNAQTDADIFNALLWWYAEDMKGLINTDGYLDLDHPYANQVDTTNIRIVNRTTIANRPEALRYLLNRMGWEPLEGGNLMDYVRKSTRKDLWFNAGTQNCAIKTSTKPSNLYLGEKAYCVIDVSGGPSAVSYPVSYLDTEPVDGWSDEYKTTKILLRRCAAGKFRMQSNKDVTFTKPFYMGVFTVTQKQYEQVMGTNPTPNEHKGDLRPVEISWNAIRGDSSVYNWPTVKTVDPATFVGKIQTKTGLTFDLPTEAQWEMACRAGTSSNYGNGGGGDNDLRLMGHSWSGNSVAVGLYLPNFWGIYDMHGNVGQWCLDFSDGYNSDPAIDYVGARSGSARSVRGYYRYSNGYYSATSFHRYGVEPASYRHDYGYITYLGFRLSRTLAE